MSSFETLAICLSFSDTRLSEDSRKTDESAIEAFNKLALEVQQPLKEKCPLLFSPLNETSLFDTFHTASSVISEYMLASS